MEANEDYFIKPIREIIEDGAEMTTWKYDEYQEGFNFQYKIHLKVAGKNYLFEKGGIFRGASDAILSIDGVEIKNGYLIIEGIKRWGNY